MVKKSVMGRFFFYYYSHKIVKVKYKKPIITHTRHIKMA